MAKHEHAPFYFMALDVLRGVLALYRTLFAASPIPIAVADPATGRFQDVNTAFATLVGRTREELVGQAHALVHAPDALRTTDGAVPGFAEASRNPEGPAIADVIVRPDGSRLEVEIRVCLLREMNPPTLLGFFDDVTERNRLAREEKRLPGELFQSQKLEALGSLAGGIAHDFNNLLAGIRGHSEMALQDLDDPAAARDDLTFVLQAADRARDLVRQILALSLLRGSIPADLPSGRYACLVVRDTGMGMGETIRTRIFEPYYTTKPLGQGTGLGLSVARGIVVNMHGAIRVESTPGEGTTFTVLLPLVSAQPR